MILVNASIDIMSQLITLWNAMQFSSFTVSLEILKIRILHV